MADQRLIDYIRNGMDRGYSAQSLRNALLRSGWFPADVDEAMQAVRNEARTLPAAPNAQSAKMGVFSKTKMILMSPTGFFEAAKYDHIGDALKYYAITLVIPLAIMGVIALVVPNMLLGALSPAATTGGAGGMMLMFAGLMSTLMVGMIIAMYFVALVGTFITAGIYHVIALLFGARKPYGETYKAFTYASTPFLLIGWLYVPLTFINIYLGVAALIAISIWALVTMIKGLSILQGISGKRAAAIILLPVAVALVLTIGLAAVSWTYMSGFMGSYTEKSFTIPTGGAYCAADGTISVMVVNTGTQAISAGDWTSKNVRDSGGSVVGTLSVANVPTKNSQTFSSNCGGTCTSGEEYTIEIGTTSGVQRIPLVCP